MYRSCSYINSNPYINAYSFSNSNSNSHCDKNSNAYPNSKYSNYQAISEGNDEDAPIYLNFRVLVGAHELKRIRVAKSKVQIKEVISLGPAAFLKGELPVTFEISADNAKNVLLSFNAQTQAS